ncbi:hypothetical protein KM043_005876 [Ampulex compressa]|nr:hypothetical protein KM043_005876 [Ampulex compressa]
MPATASKTRGATSLRAFLDVPDPPERPLITMFTSRSVSLSWAPSANSHNNPISHYVIYTRNLSRAYFYLPKANPLILAAASTPEIPRSSKTPQPALPSAAKRKNGGLGREGEEAELKKEDPRSLSEIPRRFSGSITAPLARAVGWQVRPGLIPGIAAIAMFM